MHADFVEQVVLMAGRKASYAVERNIPLVLQDISRQRKLFSDDAEDSGKVDLVIKLEVQHPSENYARVEVSSVVWATKFKRTDKDFEPGEIDIDRPFLPGMDAGMGGAPSLRQVYANRQEKNLLNAAGELNRRVFRNCRDKANPNRARSVDEWDFAAKVWKTALCEDERQALGALEAAGNMEYIVLSADGDISAKSKALLLDAGYEICRLDKEPYEVWQRGSAPGQLLRHTYSRDTLPAKYRDAEAYRDGGGLESPIYQQANPDGEKEEVDSQIASEKEEVKDTEDKTDQLPEMPPWAARNARKILEAGKNICYFEWGRPWTLWTHEGEWKKELFQKSEDLTKAYDAKSGKGFLDPFIDGQNVPNAIAAGFQVISRSQVPEKIFKHEQDSKKKWLIKATEADYSQTVISFYDTFEERDEAWEEAVKNPKLLER